MKRKRDADEPNPYKVSRANKAMRCGSVNRKGTMQGDAMPMSLVRHHGKGGKDCRKGNLYVFSHFFYANAKCQ